MAFEHQQQALPISNRRPAMQKIVTDFPIIFPTYIPTSTTGYIAQKSEAYLLADGDTLSNPGALAFTATDTAEALELTVAGTIHDSNFGIYLDDVTVGDNIYVAKSGMVNGDGYGMNIGGSDNTILNDGLVTSASSAIGINGIGEKIVNNGSLEGENDACVEASAGYGNIIHNRGTMVGTVGIAVDSKPGETLKFINDGALKASGVLHNAYFSDGGGSDLIRNSGHIGGNVTLGDGKDFFLNHGGIVSGSIIGGAGADTFVIDDKSLKIVENPNEGFDTEKSSASFTLAENVEEGVLRGIQDLAMSGNSGANILYGNKGDNHIAGSFGKDIITGGAGDDTLTGGAKGAWGDGSQDLFIFKQHCGSDVITDFEAGVDRIALGDRNGNHGGGFSFFDSYAELKSHMHQEGNDVIIDLTGADTLTLQDMQKADLHAADFGF
jgi:Ca2+-binding RTX toxin-like protein